MVSTGLQNNQLFPSLLVSLLISAGNIFSFFPFFPFFYIFELEFLRFIFFFIKFFFFLVLYISASRVFFLFSYLVIYRFLKSF